jgi:ABC-type cobalamin/Fe3+-siderophores transport system ATPase subunit
MVSIRFPKKNSEEVIDDYPLDRQSLIIIGANGSGKSHLAAFIEKKDYEQATGEKRGGRCLRISAQRIMNFDKYIPLKSYEQSEKKIIYGNENYLDKQLSKWRDSRNGDAAWTTLVIDDYNEVLSATVAKINEEYKKFYEDSKNGNLDECKKKTNHLLIDEIKSIWNEVLPERKIEFQDACVLAKFPDDKDAYNGNQMSDGERVCLYMICQVMVAPRNMLILVDEPELHLHPSIVNRLWSILEKYRQDCHFIYVTHDTEFAAQHPDAKIIWVKSFDGKNKWDYEELTDNIFPDGLLLKILGNRKNVLFIEGKDTSWDYKIYSKIFSQCYVIPCRSCHNVIDYTKAYNEKKDLHHLRVFGLIDRDYRTSEEIENLKKEKVYCLNVAEVENLFLEESILRYYHRQQKISDSVSDTLISNIKQKIIDSFADDLNKQEDSAIKARIKYHFSVLPLNGNIAEIKQYLYNDIDKTIDEIKNHVINRLKAISESKEYNQILTIYNQKGLYSVLNEIAASFSRESQSTENITKDFYRNYREFIVRALSSDTELCNIFYQYFPAEILKLNKI